MADFRGEGYSTRIKDPLEKKNRVTPMIRKVNAGTGAQLLIIKRALAFDTCLLVGRRRRPRTAVIRGDQTDLD